MKPYDRVKAAEARARYKAAHPEAAAERSRKYRARNLVRLRQENRIRSVAFRARNREELNARRRAQYAELPRDDLAERNARRCAYRHAQFAASPEAKKAFKAKNRAWADAHREEVLERRRIAYHKRGNDAIGIGGERCRIISFPEELRPIALLIQETRREIRRRRTA